MSALSEFKKWLDEGGQMFMVAGEWDGGIPNMVLKKMETFGVEDEHTKLIAALRAVKEDVDRRVYILRADDYRHDPHGVDHLHALQEQINTALENQEDVKE